MAHYFGLHQYLLSNIALTICKILEEQFGSLKLHEDVIFSKLSTVRVVYRVVIPRIKNTIKKLPTKKITAASELKNKVLLQKRNDFQLFRMAVVYVKTVWHSFVNIYFGTMNQKI